MGGELGVAALPPLANPGRIHLPVNFEVFFIHKVDDVGGLYFVEWQWVHGLVIQFTMYGDRVVQSVFYPARQGIKMVEDELLVSEWRHQGADSLTSVTVARSAVNLINSQPGVFNLPMFPNIVNKNGNQSDEE